jgi:hypothetical protein
MGVTLRSRFASKSIDGELYGAVYSVWQELTHHDKKTKNEANYILSWTISTTWTISKPTGGANAAKAPNDRLSQSTGS